MVAQCQWLSKVQEAHQNLVFSLQNLVDVLVGAVLDGVLVMLDIANSSQLLTTHL
jgi:hypothetical protein